MSELKPCPFCGEQPVARKYMNGNGRISCFKCGFGMTNPELWSEAVSMWNHRSDPTKDKLVEALQATVIAFNRLDNETPWCEVEPKWWLVWSESIRDVRAALAQVEKERGGE